VALDQPMTATSSVKFVSRRTYRVYSGHKTAARYLKLSQLVQVERKIWQHLLPEIREKKLLDIGVGGGRTSAALVEISPDYSAIDYSIKMVEATRRRFSLESIWCCDARDMTLFADGAFDFALFSMNGIDYLGHDDRFRVLREVMRVLGGGGIFVFSSHNRDLRDL
jgi:ubiquinone/menaquinone biosynthesis C-methylase UbiE